MGTLKNPESKVVLGIAVLAMVIALAGGIASYADSVVKAQGAVTR